FEALISPENATGSRAAALADALMAYMLMWLKVHHADEFEQVRAGLDATAFARG
ncbi:MAG: hypothetical protein HY897_19345, partial [Deltaproteobacteria bacterium]|nr:hypothetical protein [Deltaproteobacteria bacterium]